MSVTTKEAVKKAQRGPLGSWVRIVTFFVILATALLFVANAVGVIRLFSASSSGENQGNEADGQVVVQVPTSTEAAPTPTNTPEPTATPTEIPQEMPAGDVQEWLGAISAGFESVGCNPQYDIVPASEQPDVANALVWSQDQHGNPVHVVVNTDFCEGTGAYLVIAEIGNGYPVEWLPYTASDEIQTAGEVYGVYIYLGIDVPERFLGNLGTSALFEARQLAACLNRSSTGQNIKSYLRIEEVGLDKLDVLDEIGVLTLDSSGNYHKEECQVQ